MLPAVLRIPIRIAWIRIILESWIRIGIRMKSLTRICIKVKSRIRIKAKTSGAVEVENGAMKGGCGRSQMEARRLKMEPRRVSRPVVAYSQHLEFG
jgi:hypothetical protein